MSRFNLALLACGLLLALTSVSEAVVIVGDDFDRANNTVLGTTPVGGYNWNERTTFGQSPVDVASISGNEMNMYYGASGHAVADVNEADLALSADVRFTHSPTPTTGATATKSAGFNLRLSNMDTVFYYAANRGTVTVQMLPNGTLYVGEQTGAVNSLTVRFMDNPFVPGPLFQQFKPAGSLPATINGAPFDANQDGFLDSTESFRLGAIVSGNFLQVQLNGRTILGTSLSESAGTTGNNLSLLRNNFGGSGTLIQSNPYWDNLVGESPAPLPGVLDTFTRANSTNLGTSEVGGKTWYEMRYDGTAAITVPAVSGYKLDLGAGRVNHQAILDVNLPNIEATADIEFDLSGSGAAMNGAGFMLRKPSLTASHSGIGADGQVIIQVLPTGAFWVTEQQGGTSAALYTANPWSGASGWPAVGNFPAPGVLPQFINGLPFDLDQDGRLGGSEETFQLGAFLFDDFLQIRINGQAILSFDNLAGTGNAGNNYFSVVKNSWASSGTAVNPLYDNISLRVAVPEPATAMLLGIGVLGLIGFGRRRGSRR